MGLNLNELVDYLIDVCPYDEPPTPNSEDANPPTPVKEDTEEESKARYELMDGEPREEYSNEKDPEEDPEEDLMEEEEATEDPEEDPAEEGEPEADPEGGFEVSEGQLMGSEDMVEDREGVQGDALDRASNLGNQMAWGKK